MSTTADGVVHMCAEICNESQVPFIGIHTLHHLQPTDKESPGYRATALQRSYRSSLISVVSSM